MRVRSAKRDDAEGITTVINSAFRHAEEFFVDGDRVDVERVLSLLDTGEFLLAESDRLLGCVYVELRLRTSPSEARDPKFSRAYLGLLAVEPALQQSGLGSALMDAAEDYCHRRGASFMDLIVVSLRKELFGWYRRRGYIETGTSPFPTEIATKAACHFVEMSKSLQGV
jgi:ribosomal protein S18 acetylase RimI-like enzyme